MNLKQMRFWNEWAKKREEFHKKLLLGIMLVLIGSILKINSLPEKMDELTKTVEVKGFDKEKGVAIRVKKYQSIAEKGNL